MSKMATDKEPAQELDHIDQVEIAPDAEDGKGALVKPKNHAYHAEQPKTPAEIEAEKRFVRKVDLWILPLLSIMYFLASLDRGDVGFAASAGMTKQLHISSHQFSTIVTLFYVGFIVFQLPGDIFLRAVTPPLQLGIALIVWGGFTSSMAAVNSYPALAGLRFGIGFGEAFLQAGVLYLSLWYKRNELAIRGSWFFSTAALAGAFNGIIAYGIVKNLDGAHGIPAWKWIFLIEGVITIGFGCVIFFLLPPVPERVKWGWTEEEKQIALRRTKEAYNEIEAKIRPKHLLELFKDVKTYFYVAILTTTQINFACLSIFLPVIIKSFGYSTLNTQLFAIAVFGTGAISTVSFGYISDWLEQRAICLLTCMAFDTAGWILLLASKSRGVSLAGCFLISIGAYPGITLINAWTTSNITGFTRRAGIFAIQSMVGQTFVVAATQIYSDAPKYRRGNGFALGATVLGASLVVILRFYLSAQNKKKMEARNNPEVTRVQTLDPEGLGDHHPDFVYYL